MDSKTEAKMREAYVRVIEDGRGKVPTSEACRIVGGMFDVPAFMVLLTVGAKVIGDGLNELAESHAEDPAEDRSEAPQP